MFSRVSARLDGTGEKMKTKLSQHNTIEDWLELEEARPARQGQKRVSVVSTYANTLCIVSLLGEVG